MRVSASDRRQQLIEAAVRLMWREGVQSATLRAIAQEAGAPLVAVHYCFSDKDELMEAAVEHWLQQLVPAMAGDVATEGGLRATVHRIADDFWAALEENPPNVLAQLELALWAIRATQESALAPSIYRRYEAALGEVLEHALAKAGEDSKVPPTQLARALVGVIDAASLQYLAEPSSGAAHEIYDLMISALLDSTGL